MECTLSQHLLSIAPVQTGRWVSVGEAENLKLVGLKLS